MKVQSALTSCIITSLVSGIVLIIANVGRELGLINPMHVFLTVNLLTLAGIVAIGLWNWRKLSLHPVEWLLFACVFVTSLAANYTDRSMANVVIDIVRPALFILTVATLRSMIDLQAFGTSRMVRRLLSLTVWVTLLVVPLCYAISAIVKTLCPAYSTIDSVLGLGWLIAVSPFASSVMFLLVLFLSGKRAVYLVALLVLVVVYRSQKKKLAWIAIAVAGGLLISPFLMPANVSFIMKAPTVSWYSTPEARAYMATHPREITTVETSRDGNFILKLINISTGGRLDEMQDAISHMAGSADYIFGIGPGFEFHTQAMDEEGKKHRNLHFTPLSLIVYYGVIFFGLFAYYLGTGFLPAWRLLKDKSQPVLFSYGVYFLASLPFCFMEFNIFAYSNFAIAGGLVMASAQKKNAVRGPMKAYR